MKLVAISRVKNERDIIEPFVRHHCKIVDQLIILDDGSSDGTYDILEALRAQGLPLGLILDPAVGYEQGRYTTRLLHLAVRQYGADWIVPLDADEFIEVAPETTLRRILSHQPPEVLKVAWDGFVWRGDEDADEINPVLRMRHRIRRWPAHLHKVIVPAAAVSDAVSIAQGNHALVRAGQELASRPLDSVRLCHFPIRSVEQYAGKVAVGYLQYAAMADWKRDWGFHYIAPYRALTTSRDAFAQTMTDQSRRYSLEPDHPDLGEPTDAPLDYFGGPLTLTDAPASALGNVLRCAEIIADKLIDNARQIEAAQRALLEAKSIADEERAHIIAQEADARPVVRSQRRPGGSQHTFQSFWSGGALTPMEMVCLKSFIDCGHAFDLYSFDRDLVVPDGVRLRDAREFFSPDDVFVYGDGFGKGSPAAFANVFRYRLLAERGGWWVDTDFVCLSHDIPPFDEFFAWEDSRLINNAVVYTEPGHPMIQACLAEARAKGRSVAWGEIGPRLVTAVAKRLGLAHRAYPSRACYPIHYSEAIDVYRPARADSLRQRVDGAFMVHLWSAMLRHRGIDRSMAPPQGSILREWVDRHAVGGWVGEYDGDTFDQALLPDTDRRLRFSADLATGIEDIGRINAAFRADLDSAASHMAQLQNDLADAASREAALQAAIEVVRGSEAQLRVALDGAASREAQLHERLDSVTSREAYLLDVEKMLRDSTSWRLTEPLRRMAVWFRKTLPLLGRRRAAR